MLARTLGEGLDLVTLDLLDPDHARAQPDPANVRAVIGDVSFAKSVTIAAFRAQLDRLPEPRPRLICLMHEESARSRAQAGALGADRLVPADQALRGDILQGLLATRKPTAPSLAQSVASSKLNLTQILQAGRLTGTVEPELITNGAEFIEAALQENDVRQWLEMVWRFDDATHQHCLLVAGLAAGFAGVLGFRRQDRMRLTEAALLHDVGKSRIPTEILNKPGHLDQNERAEMMKHPVLGHAMLLEGSYQPEMLAVVRSHHELLDGSGYPDGLSGRQIPDLVRLVTICDIYAALIERRPYKAAKTMQEAFAILTSMRGKLDMDLLRAFRPIAEAASELQGAPMRMSA